ncbi:GNAT family N-acetyltransferase [Streptomyces sp. SID9124]|uniref:GNAT family N-acetyltransferase n=1 Tax=Streptomyces sp. SID9124 TaxID=2706108 RepID=UPI0013DF546E|nr:GNAT family N-acetyltransferase [Streptomyces sp. SID9124]NED11803.1 GNAT family N-acetyltransferase [Streptomyces sp. SID9124]
MSEPVVDILGDVDEDVIEAFHRLLPQLGKQPPELTAEFVRGVVTYPANLVLAARAGQRVVGLLTLVILVLPTGITARFEDVVVDESARGAGIGQALVRRGLELAQSHGARQVDLTSRPSRVAAHRLYEKAGFVRRETGVFRFHLEHTGVPGPAAAAGQSATGDSSNR